MGMWPVDLSRFPALLGLRRFSLKQRLGLGLGIIIVPLLLIAMSGYVLFQYAVASLESSHEEMQHQMMPVLRLQELLLLAQMPANDYLIHGHDDERGKFAALRQAIDAAYAKVLKAPFEQPEKRDFILKSRASWQTGLSLSEEILALSTPIGNRAGAELMIRMDERMQTASEQLGLITELGLADLAGKHAMIHQLNLQLSVILIIFLAVVTLAVFIGLSLVRDWIFAPLEQLRAAAEQYGAGNLAHRIPVHAEDEIDKVAMTFNQMAATLAQDRQILHELAVHDQLTGLFNVREFHRLLDLEITRAQRYGRSLAVLMIDIDFFKAINDQYGHPAGDVVLRNVAERIRVSLRPSDVSARYGGEEFIVLLPESDAAGAQAMAERLCAAVRASAVRVSPEIQPPVTVSIGFALYPQDGAADADLIAGADRALYAAKRAGRNRCCGVAQAVEVSG